MKKVQHRHKIAIKFFGERQLFSVWNKDSFKNKRRFVKLFMLSKNKKRKLGHAMENSLRPPEPHLSKRFRAHSCIELDIDDPRSLGEKPGRALKKQRSKSDSILQNTTSNDTGSDVCSLEILYKITDIVLIICAVLFIISAITSIILRLYGFPWVDLVNNELRFKP